MNKIEKQIINAKRQAWHNEKKAEFKALFPDVIELDEEGNELESFSEAFSSWLNELESYEVTTKDEEGNEVVNTYKRKARPMPRFTATQDENNSILFATEEYKQESLDNLVVEVDGKKFYADTVSRVDIQSAIDGASLLGQTSTMWKLAEPYNGEKIVLVTLDELRQANLLALSKKAELIGVQ